MAKRKSSKKAKRKPKRLVRTGEPPKMDEADGVRSSKSTQREEPADFMEIGEEVVPGMRLRCICRGHTDTIGRIAWSPCGRFIASPSQDRTIRIWDANDGKCLAVVTGHSQEVYTVAWSPDGETITSGSAEGTLTHWVARTGECRCILAEGVGGIRAVEYSPNGEEVASAGETGYVTIRPVHTGIPRLTIAHGSMVRAIKWSPDGRVLASGGNDRQVKMWNLGSGELLHTATGHLHFVLSVGWLPTGQKLVSAGGQGDNSVRVWNVATASQTDILEGHSRGVTSISISPDGRLLASKAPDNTVKIWRTDKWQQLVELIESSSDDSDAKCGLAFNPVAPALATLGETDGVIRIWHLNIEGLIGASKDCALFPFRYTSAKIVLVGESNVGKSCLAMRLAENRYPEDHEQGTTHGMRFWPMEAEDLHAAAKPPEGQRRDVVLWDFGGQDEYQLVHQMFLHDTTLALVLIDPTRGRTAMEEARDWNKRLEKHLAGRQAVKLLVGAKQDKKKSDLIHDTAIRAVCKECGFDDFVDLSAKTNRKIPTLRKAIASALDWDQLAKTNRPELFQDIRDEIEERRKSGEVVLLLEDLKAAIASAHPEHYEEAAVGAVADQLATQGVIVRTKLTGGDEALVLQLPVIERYAGSLIVAARNNPRGVPVLEERLLGSARDIPLPGMTKKERLKGEQERIVLECIVELMIRHGICFRHGGLLVFPTLFPSAGRNEEKLPHSISLYYDFAGAIDNIYASLIARLVVSEGFGEGRLWAGRIEFDRPGEGICGLRQIKRTGGFAHVDLFFGEETSADRRNLFTRFVEEHLRLNGVEIREHEAVKCACGEVIEERIVQANIKRGEMDVVCPVCRTKTLIGEGVARIRERDPESDVKILALRKKIEEQTASDVEEAKSRVSGNGHERRADEPIRLLHLSDLHFTGDTLPQAHLVPLLQDIRKGDFLGFDTVEYLVISGDMTDRGSDEGLDNAREFVEQLIDELGLSAQRCIFVPGNHDVQDLEEAHRWFGTDARARSYDSDENQWHREGEAIFVPDQDSYPKRLKRFSDAFFHKVLPAQPYPLEPAKQGMSYLFDDTRIQFLTLNSAWQIDQFNRKRSGLHPDAVSNAIAEAEKHIADAVERSAMKKSQEVLRLCVWHHSIKHPEAMRSTDAVELLQAAGVRLCLHGDVHELNRDQFRYWAKNKMDVVGAGSFGSPAEGRPESTPRLYNLLQIQPDHSSIRVHTRARPRPEGPWEGFYEWDDPDGDGRVPYYDIDLT